MDNQNIEVPFEPINKKKPFKLNKWMKLLILGLSGLIILSLILTVIFHNQAQNSGVTPQSTAPTPAEEIIEMPKTEDSLRDELETIIGDLNKIDPLKNNLAMPPVELDLELEKSMF